ncbi:MAG: hypothetical protein ABIZ56_08705, partial [Chthoniobacteraceae bacterium]
SAGRELSAGLVAPLAARERKVAAATDELIGKLGDIPAFVQGGEAQLAVEAQQQMRAAADSLDALALAPATESENDALSTLLKLRRQMIKKLGKSKNGGRVTNKNPENDGPVPLGELAQRIERAAEAEKNIAAETRALGTQAAPAPLLRAQDVAVGDAGEALSELDAHVAATELLRTRGVQAEQAMHAAGDLLNAKIAAAPAALTTAEGSLRELAGHLRLLAGGSTEEMLQQLEARADEAVQCLGECAACQKSGGGKSGTQVSPERVSELAEKAATLDDALRQWSENADQDDAGKGARLGALREQEATAKLPGELRALAAQIAKPGAAADSAEKAEALAARHREIAAKLAGERDQSRRLRAERLTELRESLKPFLSPAPARAGQRGGNGRGLPLSAEAMRDWQGAGGKVVLGELLGVGDEKLTSMAENLATMREQKVLYPGSIEQVDARLAALLAALQRGTVAAVREIAVPGSYRRVVENYFRALSDDFGDEKWEAAKGE